MPVEYSLRELPRRTHYPYRCPSCHQVVCVKDCDAGDTCVTCARALRGFGENKPPPAGVPAAGRWSTVQTKGYLVAVGFPPAWKVLSKPHLYVVSPIGAVTYERVPSKDELRAEPR